MRHGACGWRVGTIKSKSRLWKAVVVNCDQRPAQLRRGESGHKLRTKVSEVQLHDPLFAVC